MWWLGSGLCNRNVSFHCEISEMLIEWKAPMVSEYKGGNLKATVLYAPSTQTCICLKLEMKFFFSGLACCPHVSRKNGHQKRTFSKTDAFHRLLVYVLTVENEGFRI